MIMTLDLPMKQDYVDEGEDSGTGKVIKFLTRFRKIAPCGSNF